MSGGEADLVVRVPESGSLTVRLAYSPWLRAREVGGHGAGGCLRRYGDWTELTVPRGGTYRLDSGYDLSRARGGC